MSRPAIPERENMAHDVPMLPSSVQYLGLSDRESLSSTSSPTSHPSRTSTTTKRGLNESKGLEKLQMLSYPVCQGIIDTFDDMPEALQALAKVMRSIEKSKGIVPEERARELQPHLADEDYVQDWAVSSTRSEYGTVPETRFAKIILDLSVQSTVLGWSEAAWNCNVHYPLLVEPCERSTFSDEV